MSHMIHFRQFQIGSRTDVGSLNSSSRAVSSFHEDRIVRDHSPDGFWFSSTKLSQHLLQKQVFCPPDVNIRVWSDLRPHLSQHPFSGCHSICVFIF